MILHVVKTTYEGTLGILSLYNINEYQAFLIALLLHIDV